MRIRYNRTSVDTDEIRRAGDRKQEILACTSRAIAGDTEAIIRLSSIALSLNELAEAISRSTQVLLDSQTDSKTYNVGTGAGTSLGELINKSINITGKQVNLRIIDNLKDEVPYLVANNSAIKRETGWIPKKNVEDIIESCWKWIIRR